MMRIMIAFLFALAAGVHAQGISHSTVLVAADDYTGQDIQVTYSIGEPIVEYLHTSGVSLSQGFQQDPAILLEVDKLPIPERLSLSVYPNPAQGRTTIRLPERIEASIHIIDLLGRERAVFEHPRGTSGIDLPLQDLEPGMYILHVVTAMHTSVASRLLNIQP